MLGKLIAKAPEEAQMRLEQLCTQFKPILETKLKDGAVKQELEKVNEANRAVIQVCVLMNKKWPVAKDAGEEDGQRGQQKGAPVVQSGAHDPQVKAWETFWAGARKGFPILVKAAEEEVREKER